MTCAKKVRSTETSVVELASARGLEETRVLRRDRRTRDPESLLRILRIAVVVGLRAGEHAGRRDEPLVLHLGLEHLAHLRGIRPAGLLDRVLQQLVTVEVVGDAADGTFGALFDELLEVGLVTGQRLAVLQDPGLD